MTDARIAGALTEVVAEDNPNAQIYAELFEHVTERVPNAYVSGAAAELVVEKVPSSVISGILIELIFTVPGQPMIPTITFPDITSFPGLGWSIHRRPTNSTRISTAASGREVRTPLYATPLYEFEMIYDVLNSDSANFQAATAESLQQIMGFFLQCQGQYAAFLFADPDFNEAMGSHLGTGDGTTTVFPLMRQVGPYSEQIQAVNVVSQVYFNGVAQSGGSWTVVNANQLEFSAAPGAGTVVTADLTYYFVCRFLEDMHDYEEFMYRLHTLQSCKIRSVRTA